MCSKNFLYGQRDSFLDTCTLDENFFISSRRRPTVPNLSRIRLPQFGREEKKLVGTFSHVGKVYAFLSELNLLLFLFLFALMEAAFVIQWIPSLMFETLKSCRRKLVCAKIMPNVGKKSVVVCPPPQFQKESEKEAPFLTIANPFSSFPPFVGATLGCYNVTNSQFYVDLLTCRLHRWGTTAYR